MNIVSFCIKKREEFSWYKGSHRRFQLKIRCRNLNKDQVAKLEKAINKICTDVLPERKKGAFE